MGWRDVLSREKRASGSPWSTWAAAHGWRYEEDPQDLRGRFYPPLDGRGWREEHAWSVTGSHGSLAFVVFHRHYEGPSPTRGNAVRSRYHLAVALPRVPRADLLELSPEKVFEVLGGRLSGRFGFDEWRGRWMLGGARLVTPDEVEATLRQIDTQLPFAPEETWQPDG